MSSRSDRLINDAARVELVYASSSGVRAVGTVVGYYDHPTYIVRLDDGTTIAWSERLVRELPADSTPPPAKDDEEAAGMARWMAYWESLSDADRARELQMMADHDAEQRRS